uniref:Kin of IRRE-like protein 1 n=1 Tax=Cacopsylla melanoneura TaxID=428564 RepID=A0A8D8Z450_9HEMI
MGVGFYLHVAVLLVTTLHTIQSVHGTQQSDQSSPNVASGNNLESTPSKYTYLDHLAIKNVTALLGKTTYLVCKVRNLGNNTVSFMRHEKAILLTNGRFVYSNDQRYRIINNPPSDDWTLQIKYPQLKDSGVYDCQVSTNPFQIQTIYLTVVEPVTEIIGGPEILVEHGSTINLTCVIRYCPEPPAYIMWSHDQAIISYDSERGGVNVMTEAGETTVSSLFIQKATEDDMGVYQCSPANAKSKRVVVNVIHGDHPAAVQGAISIHRSSSIHIQIRMIFSILIALYLPRVMW